MVALKKCALAKGVTGGIAGGEGPYIEYRARPVCLEEVAGVRGAGYTLKELEQPYGDMEIYGPGAIL